MTREHICLHVNTNEHSHSLEQNWKKHEISSQGFSAWRCRRPSRSWFLSLQDRRSFFAHLFLYSFILFQYFISWFLHLIVNNLCDVKPHCAVWGTAGWGLRVRHKTVSNSASTRSSAFVSGEAGERITNMCVCVCSSSESSSGNTKNCGNKHRPC